MTDPSLAATELSRRRFDYETEGLDPADVDADPMVQWRRWFDDAVGAGCTEPEAFVLSTTDAEGWPQSRYVLLRGADERGFAFYTNHDSAKGEQLSTDGRAAMLFGWLQLHRQVRIGVTAERLPDDESDAYFASRPRGSQIGAWASPQSQPIPDRAWLEQRVEQMGSTFGDGPVLRPVFWGGWLLRPTWFEFWQGRPSRLHDRVRYTQADGGWHVVRLAP